MTNYQTTKQTYFSGKKQEAYMLFLMDSNSNNGITFDQFCKAMDNTKQNELPKQSAYLRD